MRWRPGTLTPDWPWLKHAGNATIVLMLVVISPVIATVVLVLGGHYLVTRVIGPTKEWRPWFAWRPVRLDWGMGDRVWLAWVERRAPSFFADAEYRELSPYPTENADEA